VTGIDYDAGSTIRERSLRVERSSVVRYTYQDLLSLPEGASRHEILDGALYVTAAPRVNHQRVARDLGALMHSIAREHGLGEVVGPVTVHVHDEMVFEPDLVFVASGRMDIVDPDGDVHGVPDLVIEVLSRSTRAYDRNLKRKHYLDAGVPEVWLVDVEARTLEVWRAGSEQPELAEDAVAWRVGDVTFRLGLERIFEGL
jgi:Uma2 family endonuclease